MKRFFLLMLIGGLLNTLAAQEMKPEDTEVWEPEPVKVTPGVFTAPPSDAIVLFDGSDLSNWIRPKYTVGATLESIKTMIENQQKTNFEGTDPEWMVKDGAMIVKPGGGAIETKQKFGSVQLHIEFLCPYDPGKESQGYSNSGVFFMGMYELQVLNSYENRTYSNGQAGAMYKQHPPLVNASRPPGEWQMYDVVFNAPQFNRDGSVKTPASITVFHNGVLVQNHTVLEGPTLYIGKSSYVKHADKLPIVLQDHGNKVRFRNIWLREL
ncbi:MAG: DUF1080 domain-containing protein [Saprospiraceae bacterium]|nr:DUF1080 domain-containing protein [Saprospiraceae bacterium]